LRFDPVLDVALNTEIESNESELKGINAATPISIGAGGTYSKNGAAYTSAAGTVVVGDKIKLKVRSASTLNTQTTATLRVGERDFTFSVTTVKNATDVSFTTKTNQPWNASVESDPVTLAAINAGTTVAVTLGEYAKNGGAYTNANGTVNPGDTIRVRGISASADNTNTVVTLKLGGQDRTFTIQTGKRVPAAFNPALTDASNLDPGSSVVRSFTVSDISLPSPITVSNATFTVNGTPRTSPSTVMNGDSITVTATAPNTADGSSQTVNITIGRDALNPAGGLAGSFTVATKDWDPSGVNFVAQTGVLPNVSSGERHWTGTDRCNGIYPPNPGPCDGLSGDARYQQPPDAQSPTFSSSNTVTVSSVSLDTPLSITGGEYSKNGSAFTASSGTVKAGDTLQVRVGAIIPGALSRARLTFGTPISGATSTFSRDFNVTTTSTTIKNVWTPNAVQTPVVVPSNGMASSTIGIPTTSATIKKLRVLVTLSGSPLRRSDMVIRLISPTGATLTLMDFVTDKSAQGSTANCFTYLPAGKNPLDPRNAPSCYLPNAPVNVPLATGTVQQKPWPWNMVDAGFFDGGWGGPIDTIFDSSRFGDNSDPLGAAGQNTDTFLDGGVNRNDVYRRCGTDFYAYYKGQFFVDPYPGHFKQNADPALLAQYRLANTVTPAARDALNASLGRDLPRNAYRLPPNASGVLIDPYTGLKDNRVELPGEYTDGQCKRLDGNTYYPPVAPDPRVGDLKTLNNADPSGTWALQVQNVGSTSGDVTITAFKLIFDF
jgi:hypothetical protein